MGGMIEGIVWVNGRPEGRAGIETGWGGIGEYI